MKRRIVEKRLARWGEMKVTQERTVVRYVVEEFSEHDGCWHTMRYRKSIYGDEEPADFGNLEAAKAFMRGEWGVVQETVVDEFDMDDRLREPRPERDSVAQGEPQGCDALHRGHL